MSPTPIDELPPLDVFSPEYLEDPLPVLARARARHWAAAGRRGFEILTFEKAEAILTDERFHDGAGKLMQFLGVDVVQAMVGEGRTLTLTEGDEHQRLRRVLTPYFTPRRAGALRARTRSLVDRRLDEVGPRGRCELIGDLARPVPGVVFCWMVGAPEADGDRVSTWSQALLKAFDANPDDAPSIRAASEELGAYVAELIATKRAEPGDDVTTLLLAALDAGAIDEPDVQSLLFELLTASTDNTTNAGGLVTLLLVSHPDQYRALQQDRSLVPGAVEECLRFAPRVTGIPVQTPDTVELDDVVFPAGALGWLNLLSAHRDPAAFDDPDRFDIGRRPSRGQLNFGIGRHFCLGAALARMELQVILESQLDRWSDPTVDDLDAVWARARHGAVDALDLHFTPLRT